VLGVNHINDLGWKSTVSLRDSVASTYLWFLEHRAELRG